MEKTLEEYADTVKNSEYRELFPDTSVKEAKKDEEKVKEALFQVHSMIYSKELYNKVHGENSPKSSDYRISQEKVAECLTEQEYVRLKKQIKGATLIKEDGQTLIPKTDIQDVLSPQPGLRD